MKKPFLSRFQDFKTSRAALAFVKNSLNVPITELKLSPFKIDIGHYEIQLLDLKKKPGDLAL